jgi:hypothetical protein
MHVILSFNLPSYWLLNYTKNKDNYMLIKQDIVSLKEKDMCRIHVIKPSSQLVESSNRGRLAGLSSIVSFGASAPPWTKPTSSRHSSMACQFCLVFSSAAYTT